MSHAPEQHPVSPLAAFAPVAEAFRPEEQAVEVAPGAYHPLVRAFDAMGVQNVLGDPETSRQFWQNMTFEDAQRLLLWSNGVYRGVDRQQRGFADTTPAVVSADRTSFRGYNVHYMAPSVEQAPKLLEELWEASKAATTDSRAATLLGVGTTIIHGLPYGNGRMARMAYALRKIGYDGSENHKELYTHLLVSGARGLLDMNPERADLPERFAARHTENLLRQHKYEGTPPKKVEVSSWIQAVGTCIPSMQGAPDRLTEEHFGIPLALDLITSMGGNIADYIKANGSLDGDEILAVLVFPYVNTTPVAAKCDALKEQYLRAVIDCLAHGDETVFGSPDKLAARYELGTPARDMMSRMQALMNMIVQAEPIQAARR